MAEAETKEAAAAAPAMPPVAELAEVLADVARPIAQRMRAIFYLRTHGGNDARDALCRVLVDKRGSPLLRHELGYVLGQLQDKAAVPTLTAVLRDTTDEPIVRHECAEALGAIGDLETMAVLEEFKDDESREVSETCIIALDRLKWQEKEGKMEAGGGDDNPFHSVDPAPATGDVEKSVEELSTLMLDTSNGLFERYRALFSLRNRCTTESVLAICKVLKDESALFRHEAAYVLGQMAHSAAQDSLRDVVLDTAEVGMVRHEAAEALGAIGSEEATTLLKQFLKDESSVVRESCEVALDIADYWADPKAAESVTAS